MKTEDTEQLKTDNSFEERYVNQIVDSMLLYHSRQPIKRLSDFASQESKKAVKEYKEKLEKEIILLDAGAAASDYSALHAIRHIRKLIDSL